MYVEYDYYLNDYSFNKTDLKQDEFPYYESKARALIKEKTMNRSDEYKGEELKNCTCELIDLLFSYDHDEIYNSGTAKGISSEKVGEYSISYTGLTPTQLKESKNKMASDIINKHLGITGLLYRGC